MKIGVASDHAGVKLKKFVINYIKKAKHNPVNLGTNGIKAVDYPDYAKKAALAIKNKKADRAVIICGSGVGACITANKFKGIRAAVCHDTYSAAQGVEHDDMNVICLGARVINKTLAGRIIKSFLNASFSGEKRHKRRLNKIKSIEKSNMK